MLMHISVESLLVQRAKAWRTLPGLIILNHGCTIESPGNQNPNSIDLRYSLGMYFLQEMLMCSQGWGPLPQLMKKYVGESDVGYCRGRPSAAVFPESSSLSIPWSMLLFIWSLSLPGTIDIALRQFLYLWDHLLQSIFSPVTNLFLSADSVLPLLTSG